MQIEFFELNTETLLYLLYATAFVCSDWDATPGKLLLKLRIVDENGRGLGVLWAAARALAVMLSVALLPLALAMIWLDRRKRSLHDRLVGSFVVRALPKRQVRWQGPHATPPQGVPVGGGPIAPA